MLRHFAAAALVCATLSSPAIANTPVSKVEGRVSLAGLDPSNPDDLAELQQRIDRLAFKICTRGVHKDLWDGTDIKACRASVAANGQAKLAGLQPDTGH